MIATDTPPSSVVVNTQGLESGGSWFETCSGVWYPRRRPCGVAINTSVDLINWLGKPQVFLENVFSVVVDFTNFDRFVQKLGPLG